MCPGRDRELRKQHDLETARGGGQHLLQLHWTAMHIPFVSKKRHTFYRSCYNFWENRQKLKLAIWAIKTFHFCLKKTEKLKIRCGGSCPSHQSFGQMWSFDTPGWQDHTVALVTCWFFQKKSFFPTEIQPQRPSLNPFCYNDNIATKIILWGRSRGSSSHWCCQGSTGSSCQGRKRVNVRAS